jgi:AcrR family transcriptional regulator
MTTSQRVYRGVSAQERRGERRGKLLDATLDVVGATGVAEVTVEAVCERAGLTKRYFYESFPHRDDALVACLEDLFQRLRREIVASIADVAEERRTRVTVECLVEVLTQDPRATRLYVEAPGHPLLRERRDRANIEFSLILRSPGGGSPPSRRASTSRDVAAQFLTSGTTELITSWLSGNVKASKRTIVATITAIAEAVTREL